MNKESERGFISKISLKLIFLGDQGTGKSSGMNRYVSSSFNEEYAATLGLDFKNKDIMISNKEVRLLIYDTAGQEKFRSIIPMYIRNAHIIILVYDITRKDTGESINKWIEQADEIRMKSSVYVGVGNKIDLKDKREVELNYINDRYKGNNTIKIIDEVSAKTGESFDNGFNNKIKEIIKDLVENIEIEQGEKQVKEENNKEKKTLQISCEARNENTNNKEMTTKKKCCV